MIFIYFIMKDLVPYYRVRNKHYELFNTEEPCSIFELICVVEGPELLTGVNIWEFVEHVDFEELRLEYRNDHDINNMLKITESPGERYPYYESFLFLWNEGLKNPLIFECKGGKFACLEGKHRFRLLNLFHMFAEEEFNKRFKKLPVIVVEAAGEFEARYPDQWAEFSAWAGDVSLTSNVIKTKREYEKFLCKK